MATETILKYMRDQNRPFSLNDIVENLNKQFGKAQVQKSLDQLLSKDQIIEKTYGKQKVYCVKQKAANGDAAVTKDGLEQELKELDREIAEKDKTFAENEEKLKKNEAELKTLTSTLTTDDAKIEKERLEKEIAALKEKLDMVSGGGDGAKRVVLSQESRNKIISDNEKITKEYRKRKRICNEIVNSIMEGYPKTKKNLLEEVGIETDEDCGFKLE